MKYEITDGAVLPNPDKSNYVWNADNVARKLAKEKGEIFYDRIRPCRKGHTGPRYVKNNHCVECENIGKLTYRKNLSSEERKAFRTKYHLKELYNITPEERLALLEKQNYKCLICEIKLDPNSKKTHIDHDHNTNEIRGILCHHCNCGIGLFKHNPALLRKAALYCEAS